MARVETLPYKVMREDRVRAYWYQGTGELDQELLGELSDWDAEMTIKVSVSGDVSVAEGLSDIGLDRSEALVAALVWSSPGTRMRGLGDRAVLRAGDDVPQPLSLSCEVPGKHLADSVNVTLLVALDNAPTAASALSPTRAGARLWSQTRGITLAGEGGRFPMQWVDFDKTALPPGAAWYLDWEPQDLHRQTGNGLCLFLNSQHEGLRKALAEPNPDEKAQLLYDVMCHDVGRAMLIGALYNEDLVQDAETFEDGTIGATICHLIDAVFHDYDIESLAQKAKQDRARFDALTQDRLRLYATV